MGFTLQVMKTVWTTLGMCTACVFKEAARRALESKDSKKGRYNSSGRNKRTYLSLSSTPLSGNGPQRREAGSEEEWELSFFTSPTKKQKLDLLFCTPSETLFFFLKEAVRTLAGDARSKPEKLKKI